MFRKLPDDPFFEEMNPLTKMWMFYNWAEDYHEKHESYKHLGYLIGSFIDPAAVKRLLETNKFVSSDKDFDESTRMILEEKKQAELEKASKKNKRRKKIIRG